MSDENPTILVVSNPQDTAEISDLLTGGGYESVVSGDGSDSTYSLYEEQAPDVVVMCANLDAGDARSLATAMANGDHGSFVEIVLVGETDGPIRNALDARDFEVDRFVSRPLASNALLFAVKECLEAARAARTGAETRPVEVPRLRSVPRASTASDEVVERVDRAVDLAIDDFLSEAMSSLGIAAEGASPIDDGWDEPPPQPPREPTLILSGGGEAPPPPTSPKVPNITERSLGVAPAAAGDELLEAVEDLLGEDPDRSSMSDELADLDDDLAPSSPPPSEPSGGAFARQLREKMSLMAERLFPGQAEDAGRIDVGVPHGHRTEIDLASIGIDTIPRLAPEPSPYEDIPAEEMFAESVTSEDRNDTTQNETSETPGRRVVSNEIQAQGEINLLDTDVATIIARAFSNGFTGRVMFRSPPSEKVVYFDAGRPVFATSNLPHDRMGDLLFREGKITRDQHAKSRDLVIESGRRMGEILVEHGFLKRRELLPAVRRHIEDIIYSLFAWDSGEYAMFPGDFAAAEKIRLSRHPSALVLEGVRRKYTFDQLEARFGSPAAVVKAGSSEQLKPITSSADLSRAERAAVAAMDGERSLDEIAAYASLPLLSVYQLAFGFVVLDAAEIVQRGDDADYDIEPARPPSLVGETDIAIDRQRVLAKFALVSEADYFSLLGVRRGASSFEIRRAYEAARRDYAGDSFPIEVRNELDAEIAEINEILDEAYGVLRNDELRSSYLANLQG